MPTFGKTDVGASSSASSSNKAAVSAATPASSGTVDSAKAWLSIDSGSTTSKFCIYADSAGSPGAKLAESDEITISNTTQAELTFNFSGANRIGVVSGTQYHIGPSWADPGTPSVTFGRDSTAASRNESNNYAPDPFGTPTALTGPMAAHVIYLTDDPVDGAFFEMF